MLRQTLPGRFEGQQTESGKSKVLQYLSCLIIFVSDRYSSKNIVTCMGKEVQFDRIHQTEFDCKSNLAKKLK